MAAASTSPAARITAKAAGSCKHACRNKSTCGHQCCKLTLLRQRFVSMGWKLRDVEGDGACQFRALAVQLWGDEEAHGEVRAQAVAHLRQQPPLFYEPQVFSSEVDDFVDVHSVEQYLDEMSKPGTWGDEVTLRAAADANGVVIKLIKTTETRWFEEIKPAALDERHLANNIRIGFHSEMHYVATETE